MATIILDFDRTIFDTDRFIDHCLGKLSAFKKRTGKKHELAALANRAVLNGDLRFVPGELTRFLYPDVMPFLDAYDPSNLAILTWGNEHLQRAKVESTGIADHFGAIVYTSQPKGRAIRDLLPLPPPIVLVDDDGAQLDSVAAEVPEVVRVWMRRVEMHAAPATDCTSVRSMEELDAFLRNFR